jgi:ketosteroid isomerase-like protein
MTLDAMAMRDTECRRLRSLVEVDLVTADALHAEDYQLITPNGHALTKQEYLGEVASGQLRYHVFEPASDIMVRGSGQVALLRYRARITVQAHGPAASMTCWHTDCYEQRAGTWQAVWSQATAISPEAAKDQPFGG